MKANGYPVSAKRGERGVTLILAAVMILGLLEFAGLAVDVGYLQVIRLRAQAAADAAAEGALFELKDDNSDLTAAGQHDSALNGFTNGLKHYRHDQQSAFVWYIRWTKPGCGSDRDPQRLHFFHEPAWLQNRERIRLRLGCAPQRQPGLRLRFGCHRFESAPDRWLQRHV